VTGTARIVVLVGLSAVATSARAQDLYSDRGVVFEPIPAGALGGPNLGVDAAGWAYAGTSGRENGYPVNCYRPDDPETPPLRPSLDRLVWLTAFAHDRSGVRLFAMDSPRPRLARFSCGAGEEGFVFEGLEGVTTVFAEGMEQPGYGSTAELVMGPEETWCLSNEGGLWCGRVTDGTLTFEPRLPVAGLDALVEPNPGLWGGALHIGPTEPPEGRWQLRAPTFLPNGELVVFADVRYFGQEVTDWYTHVIAAGEDGVVDTLLRPSWDGAMLPDGAPLVPALRLKGAGALLYEANLDALLVWPIVGQEYPTEFDRRGAGIGLVVLPYGDTRAGYASATAAMFRTSCVERGCEHGPGGEGTGLHLPDGGVAVSIGGLHRLILDPDGLDMDGDGLSWSEEEALGSSDLTVHSDGGPVRDSIEVRVAGTDPSEADDDPAPPGPPRVVYGQSGMIVRLLDQLGLPERGQLSFEGGGGPSGPLCAAILGGFRGCFLDRGAPIPYPGGDEGGLVLSPDGSHGVISTERGYERVFLEDGRRELAVPVEEIAALETWSEHTSVRVHPVDPGLLFVSTYELVSGQNRAYDELQLWAFEAGQPGRVVYDHQVAGCDSGLGPCDPVSASGRAWGGPHDLLFGSAAPVGWMEEMQRFLIAAGTVRDRYLVAVPLEGPPAVLAHGLELSGGPRLAGLPGYLMPTGHGDYLTNAGLLDGWLRPRAGAEIEGLTGVTQPAVAWGDIVVQ